MLQKHHNKELKLCKLKNICTTIKDTWEWKDGSAWDYSNWLAGEPNGAPGENCLDTYTDSYWNDASCDLSRPYVCKL